MPAKRRAERPTRRTTRCDCGRRRSLPNNLTDSPASTPRSLRDLRHLTPARVALGRSGASLPTQALLDFTLAHARARDAVHAAFDTDALDAELRALGLTTIELASRAQGRAQYLSRPDLGRQLDDSARDHLAGAHAPCDVVIMIGDGLSPVAVGTHAVAVIRRLLPRLAAAKLNVGPVAIASGARVALGDEVGALLKARILVLLIGERPGLSAPHSLGAYLTFAPRPGLTDADRNCVSNIQAAGISPDEAAFKIAWLVDAALARQLSGVALKDESGGDVATGGLAELTGPV